jgi:cytochrome c oxidase subunit 2
MSHWLPFWPLISAKQGVQVDHLIIAEVAVSALTVLIVFAMMVTFSVRYRRGSPASRAHLMEKTWRAEIGWTTATLIGFLALFVWGAGIYIWLYRSPPGDIEIYVVGKQWMWKVQHPGGQREINELHVPAGKVIRLVLASQDVIHSFFIPAFRIKHDVVPGTYETLWFKATETGVYRFECTQYCGEQHATMTGDVVVMTPAAYETWLVDQGVGQSLAEEGEALFRQYGCSGCHGANSTVRAPPLEGLYGSVVHLQDGSVRRADEAYLRDCILEPRSFTVAGYPPVMPDFSGRIGEDDLMKVIAYIQSLAHRSASWR